VIVSALAPSMAACSGLEPEVGERLVACVDADSDPNATVSFKDKIRPLMDGTFATPRPCADCHYASRGTREGLDATGFNLETLGSLRKGGIHTGGDIVVPGQPCKSAIVQKLKGTYANARMPKGGPYWDAQQLQLMIDWIAEGANGADNE
jgi:hypothetical protein